MPRFDGRKNDQMREVKITPNYILHPAGSCLIEFGNTKVICTASVEDKVPPFLRDSGQGWITAEYGMLPGSTNTRIKRDRAAGSGRTMEIQRLIGRSLRAVVDMEKLGERTIKVDCDVIQADGGTRTASITGGYVALRLAIQSLMKSGELEVNPLVDQVAAISVGVHNGHSILDLPYEEDSQAETDMNVVMLKNGDFVEVQATAEGISFSKKQLDELLGLAEKGIRELFDIQNGVLS